MQDFFLTFGVERTFGIDDAALERRFHFLQRQSHPDRFTGRTAEVAENALTQSSNINEAYRTLRDPHRRSKYLLALYGFSVEKSKSVPMDLFELVMNVQEKISEYEFASSEQRFELSRSVKPIIEDAERRKTVLENESEHLRFDWDSIPTHAGEAVNLSENEKRILQTLASKTAAQTYISTLLNTMHAAMNGESLVLKH
ncbi:MAG: Fe-S protein assembly co-chaperone HscB [bacterium]